MDDAKAINYKIKVTGGILFAFLFIPILEHILLSQKVSAAQAIIFSRFYGWIGIALLVVYAKWMEKTPFFVWRLKRYKFWFYPASFGALYLLALGSGIVSLTPGLFGLADNREVPDQIYRTVNKSFLLMIMTALTAGIVEELIFRAYLVPRLELIFKNKYMPVILSASMFSALHLGYYSWHQLLFTFLFGIVFAIHYQWYRNISILIITHAIIDLLSFLIFGFVEAYKISHHIIQH